MTSQSAARNPDETNEAEAVAGDRLESRSLPRYVVGGLAIAIAFVLGATLVYHGIFAALSHVR
jgi:hypothetical protein